MKGKLYKLTWGSGFTVLVINADENKVIKQLEAEGIITLEEIGSFKSHQELVDLKKKALEGLEKEKKNKDKR